MTLAMPTAAPKAKRKARPFTRTLRTQENAERIVELIEQGQALRDIARVLAVDVSAISHWIRDDGEKNGGRMLAQRYARAIEFRAEMMAEELLSIADDRSFIGQDDANAIVTQQRLAVDTRKWLLSKMLPRKYGDRIEVGGDPSAPIVTRIELVAVEPVPRARVIEHSDDDGRDDG